jgi:hypothetical protein
MRCAEVLLGCCMNPPTGAAHGVDACWTDSGHAKDCLPPACVVAYHKAVRSSVSCGLAALSCSSYSTDNDSCDSQHSICVCVSLLLVCMAGH